MELFEEYECPVCKKHFTIQCERRDYGWSFGEILFCSYGCMRVVEKKYLLKVTDSGAQQKKKLPIEYREVWGELMRLREYCIGYEKLRRLRYRSGTKVEPNGLKHSIQGYCKRIAEIKTKYASGVSALARKQYGLLYRYILSGWNGEKIIEYSGLTYEELCDEYVKICKSLKRSLGNTGRKLNRWICRESA